MPYWFTNTQVIARYLSFQPAGSPVPMAEGVGFEPTVRITGSPDFKAGSLNRSDTLPCILCIIIRYFYHPKFAQKQGVKSFYNL